MAAGKFYFIYGIMMNILNEYAECQLVYSYIQIIHIEFYFWVHILSPFHYYYKSQEFYITMFHNWLLNWHSTDKKV